MSLSRAALLLLVVLAGAACEDEQVELSRPETPPPIHDAGVTLLDAPLPDAPSAQAQLSPPHETR